MGKVMVVAGEVSGDMHAAGVIKEIKEQVPESTILGMGGEHLKKEGVEILIDATAISTIGFAEALTNLKQHLNHLKILKKSLNNQKIDVLFLVDYSGFNMLMARIARKKNIPVVNYFSPSAWVWGKWRAKWMAKNNAAIASVFPMEAEVYRQAGAKVHYVGHPLVDLVKSTMEKEEIYQKLELDPNRDVIALLPGSRQQEIVKLLPYMLETARRIQKERKDIQFVIPIAEGIDKVKLGEMAAKYKLILKLVSNFTYELMKIAQLMIVASGTATLEGAIMGTPMIIVYKTSQSSYLLGKHLVDLDFIGLPNIIADRKIVPEFVQNNLTVENIYREAFKLLDNSYLRKIMINDLAYVRNKLGEKGAVKRTAELVIKEGNLF